MFPKKYFPIDCNLYDRYLDFATTKTSVRICYLENTEKLETVGCIKDVFTENKEEFLILSTGFKLRLDQIVSCTSASE